MTAREIAERDDDLIYEYMERPEFRLASMNSRTRDASYARSCHDPCFRIQREASGAAGHHIPLVVENVRGAIPWVGRSRWNYGSYHLWGDTPALMPMVRRSVKVEGFRFDGSKRSFQQSALDHIKNTGGSWFNIAHNKGSGVGRNPDGRNDPRDNNDHIKCGGDWFDKEGCSPMRRGTDKSKTRKFASAAIAKIPLPLASHIARTYFPFTSEAAKP